MEQDGDRLIASHLGPRCEPICSERQVVKVIAAEGFCEVRHPRQTRRTEQPKGGETVRASEMTRARLRPMVVSYFCAVLSADRPAFGGRLIVGADVEGGGHTVWDSSLA